MNMQPRLAPFMRAIDGAQGDARAPVPAAGLAPALAPSPGDARPPEHSAASQAVGLAREPSSAARRTCTIRKRIIRNGLLVVGGSTLASVTFTALSFVLFGDVDYYGSLLAALIIPLVVASIGYVWIARLTLQLEHSNAALDRLAHSDPLTGIANRRAAIAQIDRWMSDPFSDHGCTIAIGDIDEFKRINDTFGHATGDAALRHVAMILEKLALQGWLVARIGGEEFLIAAPRSAADGFASRIEEMRAALAATALITPVGPHTITASFGVAERRPGEAIERLLSRADGALYRAKQTGRNKVEHAA